MWWQEAYERQKLGEHVYREYPRHGMIYNGKKIIILPDKSM
jgi:hypothetical protein